MPVLFNENVDAELKEAARREGVEYTYVVEGQGNGHLGREARLILHISLPNKAPCFAALSALEEEIRREGAPFDGAAIRAYTIKSTDEAEVFARYVNHTFQTPESPQSIESGKRT